MSELEIAAILYEVDPMLLNFAPEDEYSPEAKMIVKELVACKSVEDIYDLLVRVFVKMFNAESVDREASKKLHLAAKIFFDKEIFDYVISSIKTRKESQWYVERLTAQVRESDQEVPFPVPDNYNQGLEQGALLVEANKDWFEGPGAHLKVAEKIRGMKVI